MGTIEKLGLILMAYGIALHTWHILIVMVLASMLLLVGAGIFLVGGIVEEKLRELFPDFPW